VIQLVLNTAISSCKSATTPLRELMLNLLHELIAMKHADGILALELLHKEETRSSADITMLPLLVISTLLHIALMLALLEVQEHVVAYVNTTAIKSWVIALLPMLTRLLVCLLVFSSLSDNPLLLLEITSIAVSTTLVPQL
jgi:hypothetical protein